MKKIISSMNQIKFAIKATSVGGQVTYTPVVKKNSIFSNWTPIVKLYPNEYILLPYEVQGLTIEECDQHIEGYKAQMILQQVKESTSTQYINR